MNSPFATSSAWDVCGCAAADIVGAGRPKVRITLHHCVSRSGAVCPATLVVRGRKDANNVWANKKAWMTSWLMVRWFCTRFVPFACGRSTLPPWAPTSQRKVVLLLDNFSAHHHPGMLCRNASSSSPSRSSLRFPRFSCSGACDSAYQQSRLTPSARPTSRSPSADDQLLGGCSPSNSRAHCPRRRSASLSSAPAFDDELLTVVSYWELLGLLMPPRQVRQVRQTPAWCQCAVRCKHQRCVCAPAHERFGTPMASEAAAYAAIRTAHGSEAEAILRGRVEQLRQSTTAAVRRRRATPV